MRVVKGAGLEGVTGGRLLALSGYLADPFLFYFFRGPAILFLSVLLLYTPVSYGKILPFVQF